MSPAEVLRAAAQSMAANARLLALVADALDEPGAKTIESPNAVITPTAQDNGVGGARPQEGEDDRQAALGCASGAGHLPAQSPQVVAVAGAGEGAATPVDPVPVPDIQRLNSRLQKSSSVSLPVVPEPKARIAEPLSSSPPPVASVDITARTVTGPLGIVRVESRRVAVALDALTKGAEVGLGALLPVAGFPSISTMRIALLNTNIDLKPIGLRVEVGDRTARLVRLEAKP